MAAKFPAAFINVIAEEGSKTDAIEYLQQTWDDLQILKQACVAAGYSQEHLQHGVLRPRHVNQDRKNHYESN